MPAQLTPQDRIAKLARLRWLFTDTLYRLENASDSTMPEDVLVHGQELMELAWDLGITDEPWIEGGSDRPGYVRLEVRDPATGFPPDCDPVTGKFLPVYLATPVANTDPAELARFTKLLRLWLGYLGGLQAPSNAGEPDGIQTGADADDRELSQRWSEARKKNKRITYAKFAESEGGNLSGEDVKLAVDRVRHSPRPRK